MSTGSTRIDLETLSDDDLAKTIEQAQGLLKSRKEQRRTDALESARAKLAEAGLTPADLVAATKKRSSRAANADVLKAGQRYVNPDNPKEVWVSGRGRRPSWFKALEKKGRVPSPE